MENVPLICLRAKDIRECKLFPCSGRGIVLDQSSDCRQCASSSSLRFTQFPLSHRQANRKFIETCDVGEVRLQHRKKMTSMLEDIKSNQRRAFLSDGFTFSRKQRHSPWNFKPNAEISAKNRSNHDLCCAAGNSRPKIATGI